MKSEYDDRQNEKPHTLHVCFLWIQPLEMYYHNQECCIRISGAHATCSMGARVSGFPPFWLCVRKTGKMSRVRFSHQVLRTQNLIVLLHAIWDCHNHFIGDEADTMCIHYRNTLCVFIYIARLNIVRLYKFT